MPEVLRELLMSVLYAGLIAIIPVVISAVKKGSDALIEYLGVKSDNEIVNQVFTEIITFTEEAVTCTMQTYVDALKKEGTFTEECQEIAFNKALESAKAFISEESKELFESVYGDLDEYLKLLIESKVKKLKIAG